MKDGLHCFLLMHRVNQKLQQLAKQNSDLVYQFNYLPITIITKCIDNKTHKNRKVEKNKNNKINNG